MCKFKNNKSLIYNYPKKIYLKWKRLRHYDHVRPLPEYSTDHVRPQRRSILQTFSMPTICCWLLSCQQRNLFAHTRSYRVLIRERSNYSRTRGYTGMRVPSRLIIARQDTCLRFAKGTWFAEHATGSISIDYNNQK